MEELKTSSKKFSSTKGLDLLIFGSILLTFFAIPFFFTGMASQGIGFEKMIVFYFLVLVGVVAWATKGVITGELSIKRTPLDIPILATIITFSISAILSVSGKDSLIGAYGNPTKGIAAVVIFSLFYYLVVNNIKAEQIKTVFWTILGSAFLVFAYSLLQLNGIFLLPTDISKTISFNPIGSLSGLTMFVVMMLPLFVIGATQVAEIFPAMSRKSTSIIKGFSVVGILSGLLIAIYLNGFTFWPIPVVGMVVVLMFFMAKIIKTSNNNLIIPLGTFLVLIIFLVLGNYTFKNLQLPAEVSLSRKMSWDIARNSVMENPIFGSGPSTFYYDFSKFKDITFNASPLWNVRFEGATGIIFELLATVGVVGALAAVIVVLISLSISFLALIKSSDNGTGSMLLGLFASLVSSLLIASLFPLNDTLVLYMVMMAILTVSASIVIYPEKFQELKLSFRASAKYALALAAIFLVVSSGVVVMFTMGLKMYMADVYAMESLKVERNEDKIEKLNKAISLAPYQDSYYLALANNYMALANQAAVGSQDQAVIGANLSQAMDLGKKAVDIAPNKAANNEAMALIYENASFYTRGALEWAESLYKKTMELDPQNPTAYLRTALVNMAKANAEKDETEKKYFIEEAVKMYDLAIGKKQDLAAAYYGKAVASEKLGKLDDSIEQLKNASLIARDNLDYRFELGRLYFNRGVTDPKLNQNASQEIAENDISAGTSTEGQLSVQPSKNIGGKVADNADLATAEQLFLSILAVNENHANARYSLAVLYQKIGENDKARTMVNGLLNILPDEKTKEAVSQQFQSILQ